MHLGRSLALLGIDGAKIISTTCLTTVHGGLVMLMCGPKCSLSTKAQPLAGLRQVQLLLQQFEDGVATPVPGSAPSTPQFAHAPGVDVSYSPQSPGSPPHHDGDGDVGSLAQGASSSAGAPRI